MESCVSPVDNPFVKPNLIVIGLGNPGAAYRNHRHNIGFRCLDAVASNYSLSFKKRNISKIAFAEESEMRLVLVKPLTFMNESGALIPYLRRRWPFDDLSRLLVVVDNMDLPPGEIKFKNGGGTAGHNGLKSLTAALGGGGFLRLYLGVGRPQPGEEVISYVLGTPPPAEREAIEAAEQRGAAAIGDLLSKDISEVMNVFNAKEPSRNS